MGQITRVDSLEIVAQTAEKEVDRASAYQRLAWLHILKDSKAAAAYNDTAHAKYLAIKDDRGVAQTNYKYGVIYRYTGDYTKAHQSLDLYKAFAVKVKDSAAQGDVAYQKGVVYSLQGDYENSLRAYYETLHWYELKKDSASYGFTWNSIGLVQKNLKRYADALESFEKAQTFNLMFDKKADVADAYNNMGSIYYLQMQYDTAENLHKKALALDIEIDNQWGVATNYFNLGNIQKAKGNQELALSYYRKAAKIQKTNNYTNELVETNIGLAALYNESGNYRKAEEILTAAVPMASESRKSLKRIHQLHAEVSERLGDHKKALFHSKKYNEVHDAVLNEASLKQINLLSQRYEAKKRDEEIAVQQLKLNEQENELRRKDQQFKLAMVGIVSLLLLLLGSWVVYNQRQKRKAQQLIALRRQSEIETLESLIQGEEKERLRIAQELHDGLNGDLSAIKFKLNSLLESNDTVVKEVVSMLDKSCEQVRTISHNLVPPALEKFDLRTAASDYCFRMNSSHEPEISFQYLGNSMSLSKKVEINLYRVIQELITNSVKHANATEIHVQLSASDDTIHLTVEDDGSGFNTSVPELDGIGLKNVKSRVAYLDGELDVISNLEGTSISILIDKSNLQYD